MFFYAVACRAVDSLSVAKIHVVLLARRAWSDDPSPMWQSLEQQPFKTHLPSTLQHGYVLRSLVFVCGFLRVQVPNYMVSTQNHDYTSEYGNPKYPMVGYFGSSGSYFSSHVRKKRTTTSSKGRRKLLCGRRASEFLLGNRAGECKSGFPKII